jgi:hypothetical protein
LEWLPLNVLTRDFIPWIEVIGSSDDTSVAVSSLDASVADGWVCP